MANPYRHNDRILNASPYHDDFDPKKNYMKVLYRPAMAVQARELTQSQTYLNNQLAALGGYFFKDGTPIDGAKISFSTNQPIIRIVTPSAKDPEDFIRRKFVGATFKGLQSGQEIQIIDYHVTDKETTTPKYYLVFSYLGSSIMKEEFKTYAADGEVITFSAVDTPIKALVAACSEGTIFVDGYFIYVPKSENNLIICINNDDAKDKEYHIGFDITRKVITASEDPYLNDNASGFYNYKAPGANRYQINAFLTAYERDELPSKNDTGEIDFIPGIVIKNGIVIKEQPSELSGNMNDLLAKRTYEESGSYTVNPWKIQIKEDKDDDSKYIVSVEPGMGYVYGYRVSNLVSQNISVDKPRNHIIKENNVDYIADGIFTYAKFESDDNTSSQFTYNALQGTKFLNFLKMQDVSVMSEVNGGGTEIGVCKVTDVYKQGNYFIIYLTNVGEVISNFARAKSLAVTSDKTRFVNLYLDEDEYAVVFGTDTPKIIPTGYSMVTPNVVDNGKTTNFINKTIEYQFLQTYEAKAVSTKSLTFSTSTDNYTAGIDTNNGILYIYQNSNGKHIDVTNLVVTTNGTTVTIEHQNKNSAIFIKDETYTICARYTLREGTVRTKTAIEYTESVQIGVTTEDTITLKHEDIIDIVSITEEGQDTDYKDKVVLDNGQTDFLYDYGKISGLKKIYETVKSDKTYNITYRYYKHNGNIGPFVASSYIDNGGENAQKLLGKTITELKQKTGITDENKLIEILNNELYTIIPTYRSKSSGKIYKLRDSLDFRVKVSELSDTRVATFYPNSRTRLSYNLGIYLPRIDAVWVDKNGNFGITKGIESQQPEPPEEKDGVMTIYYLYNEAYGENVDVKYINNQRHTMSDITSIENRLTNVENVLSLSLLEQSAVNMQITDDDGLNRYKSGIFTDNFSSYNNSDYTNEEWNASIDAVECSLRPLYNCEEHEFTYSTGTGVTNWDNVVLTLTPSGTEIFAKNDALSEATNIQSLMFHVWTGSLKLTPSIDTWVTDLGNILVSETWVETPKPPTAYRTWSVSTTTDVKTSTSTSTSTQRRNANDGWGSYWTDTYKTTATTKTATIQTKTTTETTSYTGSWTTSDVYTKMESQDTYMRERLVEYSLKGMRPGMEVQARMDGVDLTLLDINGNNEDSKEQYIKNYNIVKSDGTLTGTFRIPPNTSVGTKLVEFFDVADTSAANAEYTANGKTVWTNIDRTYIRTWTSLVSTNTVTSYSQQNLGTTTSTVKVSSVYKNLDPIAESFYVDNPNGIMLESIDIFFAKKDEQVNVELIVVECENGYPSQTMVPFSKVSISPNEYIKDKNGKNTNELKLKVIGTAELEKIKNGTATLDDYATNFKFDSPLYLAPETEYAFILIAPSYNYEIYTSTLGKADLISGVGIREQPYIGSMFKSQNLRTWTAEQLSDITFRIHKYKFNTTDSGYASFAINKPLTDFKTAMQTLALNTFVPNRTNIDYEYQWEGQTKSTPFNNREDIFNTEIKLLEKNKNSLLIGCDMMTNDENISPMIDLEQVYGIFTNNNVTTSSSSKLISDNLGVGKYTYHCGTYISNPVSLENSGEDLRVILDAITPNNSGIKVYFKTTTYNPLYVHHGTTGYGISEQDVLNNIGKTMQVYWYNEDTDCLMSPYTYKNQNSVIKPPKCIITGYVPNSLEEQQNGSNVKLVNKVFIRAISDEDVFSNVYIKTDGTSSENSYPDINGNVTGIYLLPILDETNIPCAKWTSKVYSTGQYVLHNDCIWRANRTTTASNTPSEYSIVWDKIDAIKVISEVKRDKDVVWRPMSCETIDISNTKNVATTIDDVFKEYTYYSELEVESEFTDFVIRIDLYSQDEVNVPRVKNLRAIALV